MIEPSRPEQQPSRSLVQPERLYEGYIFDLDGTIYLGPQLLPGARRLIAVLRGLRKRVLFLSNNPTKDPEAYAERLSGLGIPADPSEVLNTVVTTTRWLIQNYPTATVFAISEEPLKRALAAAGMRMSEDPAEIDFVIASYDRTFEYRKLQIAFDALWYHRRARLLTTNPDRYCPFPGGRGEPDAAAIVAAIEACTGVACELNLGKPGPVMLATALDVLGLPAAECVMTGDRLYTDIRMGLDAGMASALVLTGETTPGMLSEVLQQSAPHYVLERVDQLLPPAMWRELGWHATDD
jgi:arabinose operon protein AraL